MDMRHMCKVDVDSVAANYARGTAEALEEHIVKFVKLHNRCVEEAQYIKKELDTIICATNFAASLGRFKDVRCDKVGGMAYRIHVTLKDIISCEHNVGHLHDQVAVIIGTLNGGTESA